MHTGVFTKSHLDRSVSCVLSVFLLMHVCVAAPGLTGAQREETGEARLPVERLHNPFGSTEDERGLLQGYIQANMKSSPEEPEISTREQEIFFLFRLYDFDRSGFLDGLEMMKLLSDYNSHQSPGTQATEQVVSMVDFLLQTQDLNQDGLLTPSELLSSALTHTQDSSNNTALEEEQEVKVEVEPSNIVEEQKEEEVDEGIQPQQQEQPQHEVETEQHDIIQEIDQHEEQQIAEAAVEEEQVHRAPVHIGQPEI